MVAKPKRYEPVTSPIEAYRSGIPVAVILEMFSISRRTLYRQLAQAEPPVPLRRPRKTTIIILNTSTDRATTTRAGPEYIEVGRTTQNLDRQTHNLRAAYHSGMLVDDIIRRYQVCCERLYQAIGAPDRHHRTSSAPPQGVNAVRTTRNGGRDPTAT